MEPNQSENFNAEILSRIGDNPKGIYESDLTVLLTRPGVFTPHLPYALKDLIEEGKIEVEHNDALKGRLLIPTKPNKAAVKQLEKDEKTKD